MGRTKGTPKTGGRTAGTPNKVTADLREWIAHLLQEGQEQFSKDLKAVEPMERLRIYTGLLKYVLPQAQEALDEGGKENFSGVKIVVGDQTQADELRGLLERL